MKYTLSLVAASVLTMCASQADAFLGKLIGGLMQGVGKAAVKVAPAGVKTVAPGGPGGPEDDCEHRAGGC